MTPQVPGPLAGGIERCPWIPALVAIGLLMPQPSWLASAESPVPAPVRPEITPSVMAEWAQAEIRTAEARAEGMAKDGRYEDAAELLEVVRRNIQAQSIGSHPAVAEDLARVAQRQTELRSQAVAAGERRHREERTRALESARGQADSLVRQDERRRSERLRRIRELRDKGFLDEALAQCRVLRAERRDDTEDPEIRHLFAQLQEAVHERHRLTTAERQAELRQEISERITEDLLPTGVEGLPLYPPDWSTRGPGRTGVRLGAQAVQETWRDQLQSVLATRVSLHVDQRSAVEVLRELADSTRLNLIIDPGIVAGADKPISLQVDTIRLENALTWISRLIGTHWHLSKGAVVVGGQEDQDNVLSVIDVTGLVFQSQDHPGRVLDVGPDQQQKVEVVKPDEPALTAEQIADLIKKSIGPGSWDAPGRGITIRNATLFISAPQAIQDMVAEFLRSQENSHSLQVRVDTRWLEVRDSFMEEVGVQWSTGNSLVFVPGLVKGFQQGNDSHLITGTTANALPPTVFQRPASAPDNPAGITVSVGFLPSYGVSAILTAIERSGQGREVQGPSLTTLNGVRSSVFQGRVTSYISGYTVASSNLEPQISNLSTGMVLDIKPLISADRKYVTMEFRPTISSVRFFTETITAFRQFGNGRAFGGGVANGVDANGIPQDGAVFGASVSAYPLELPNVILRRAAVTITLPDQASAVIGGLSTAIDEHAAARVPLLGTIPFLGRLFGTRGRYSEHGQLYLLATATIIPYDELETTL